MPEFEITDQDTGITLVATGKSAPTESEAVSLFDAYYKENPRVNYRDYDAVDVNDDEGGFFNNAKTLFSEAGKSVVRGTEDMFSKNGTLIKILGENLAVDEDKRIHLIERGMKDSEIDSRARFADFLVEWGNEVEFYWEEQMNTGFEVPDEEIFRGSFMENPSWTRAVSLVAGAIPSLGAAAVSAIATKNPAVGIVYLSGQSGADIYNAGRDAGLNVDKSTQLFAATSIGVGAIETAFGPLKGFTKGGTGKAVTDILIGALRESGTEGAQTFWENLVKKYGIDDTQSLFEGIVEAMIAGAGSGGALGAVTSDGGKAPKNVTEQDKNVAVQTISDLFVKSKDKIESTLSKAGKEFSKTLNNKKNIDEDLDVEDKPDTEKFIKLANNGVGPDSIFSKMKEISEGGVKSLDKAAGVISTRAGEVDIRIKDALRKFEFENLMNIKKNLEQAEGFVSKMDGMSDNDFIAFDIALKNRDQEAINEFLESNDMSNEYQGVRDMLDNFVEETKEVGIKMGFIEGYFPRSITNYKKYMDHKKQGKNWNQLNKAIREEERRIGYNMDEEAKALYIAQVLSGYGENQIRLGSSKFTKKRTVEFVTEEENQFYKPSTDALIEYIRSMTALIEGRKFIGKESKETTKIRTKIKRAKSRLIEIKDTDAKEVKKRKLGQLYGALQGIQKDIRMAPDLANISEIEESAARLQAYISNKQFQKAETVKSSVLKELSERIETLENDLLTRNRNVENSIGQYVSNLVKDKVIRQKDAETIAEILRARLNQKGINNPFWRSARDLVYVTTINDITNGITQLGDIFLAVYKNNPYIVGSSMKRVLFKQTNLSRESIGLTEMLAEFEKSRGNTSKIRDFIFKWSGTTHFDAFGKSVVLDSSWLKLQKLAKKNDAELVNELERVFGDNSKTVLRDLKSGRLTKDVKYILFTRLADLQPITLSEVPEGYLRGGNGRVLYALKTFTLKAMDIARNDAVNEMRKGNYKKGAKNLFKLAVAFMLMGATTDRIKDFIMLREFDLTESAINGLLQLLMMNRYTLNKGGREGYGKSFLDSLIPPFFLLPDTVIKDFKSSKDINDYQMIRLAPLIGEPYYNWFGGGK